MIINHDTAGNRFFADIEGHEAHVEYVLKDGTLDILHTIVSHPLEGRGIASQLVRHAYDYALSNGLKPAATCTYAKAWLDKHQEYKKY
jgi:predicted GNAT family acetyltransferase